MEIQISYFVSTWWWRFFSCDPYEFKLRSLKKRQHNGNHTTKMQGINGNVNLIVKIVNGTRTCNFPGNKRHILASVSFSGPNLLRNVNSPSTAILGGCLFLVLVICKIRGLLGNKGIFMLIRQHYSNSTISEYLNLPHMGTMTSKTPSPHTSTQDAPGHPEPWELTQKTMFPLKSAFLWSCCYTVSFNLACCIYGIELTNMNANV